jgi:hypothetical protein
MSEILKIGEIEVEENMKRSGTLKWHLKGSWEEFIPD